MKEPKDSFKVIHESLNQIEKIATDSLESKVVSRFIDNGDNTVIDTKTGLMWIKQHSQLGGDFAKKITWDDAIKACKNLDYAEHKDWRLPTREELCSIVDLLRHDPAIDPIFSNTPSDWHWTATELAHDADGAWYISFGSGYVGCFNRAVNCYVKPVRRS